MIQELTVAIISGLAVGAVYALIGLGLVLAIRATGTFNFAHGELMLLPAFVVGYWTTKGIFPMAVALLLALVLGTVIGALFYLLVLKRTNGLPHWMGFIATLGLASILQGVMGLWFGTSAFMYQLPGLDSGGVTILGARISTSWVVLACVGLVVSVGLACALRFTSAGTAVRAAGQDALLAGQSGINVGRVFITSWAVAALLAGLAGILYGSTTVVSIDMAALAWAAFPAVVLGGLDSIEGAIVGGLAIGVIQRISATFLGTGAVDLVTYGLLLAILMVRPQGIFGTKEVTRL